VFPRKANQKLPYGKLDWQIDDRNTFSTSVNVLNFHSPNGVLTANTVERAVSQNGEDGVKNETNITKLTSRFTASMVNEVRVQYSRDFEFETANATGPSVIINNLGGQMRYGMPDFLPRSAFPNEQPLQIADDFPFLRGLHDFKLGLDLNLVRETFSNLFQGGGVYTFNSLTAFVQDFGRVDTGANTRKHYASYAQAFDITSPEGRNDFKTVDYN